MTITLADVKHRLRIDNNFSDAQIQALMDTADATLKVTIGYDDMSSIVDSRFEKLHETFIAEYVRALYFQIDNTRILDVLQVQMQALIKDSK